MDDNAPAVGILGWEDGDHVTLAQLEQMPGNIAHPATFDFPIVYRRVPGAHFRTVVVQPSPELLEAMITAARQIEAEGVVAIMTSCGFNALYQQELADAVDVPVVASSLLQVPMVARMLRPEQSVCVLTADRPHLTERHLRGGGIPPELRLRIAGIEETGEFARIRDDPGAALDVERFEREVVEVALAQTSAWPQIGAVVMECTDLPPVSAAVRRATGLPVFDIVTLAHMVYEALAGDRFA